MILFSSKKEKQNQTSMLSIGPCDTLIKLYLNHEEYYSSFTGDSFNLLHQQINAHLGHLGQKSWFPRG